MNDERERSISNFKALLINEKITDVKLVYDTVTLIFATGHEIAIESSYDSCNGTTGLDIDLFFSRKENIGGFKL